MTQDEIIIAMAREAGFEPRREMGVWGGAMHELKSSELSKLKRFATLVAEPWIETNKALAKEIIELQKQAEQSQLADASLEPVAYIYKESSPETGEFVFAAPVRTKDPCNPLQDLMDDEIYTLYSEPCSDREMVEFARAAIAADREKNRG